MSKNIVTGFVLEILIVVLVLLPYQGNIFAAGPIRIIVNGQDLTLSAPALLENGTTLVPLRDVFEALGAKPQWDISTRSVTAEKDGIEIWLQLNNKIAKVGNKEISLSVPPKLVRNTTLVPLRFVSESFGISPDWEGKTNTITINTNNELSVNNTIRINSYNIDELFELTYGEILQKYGKDYYQDKAFGGVYLRYDDLNATFFFNTAEENDFNAKIAAIALRGTSTFFGVKAGMSPEQIKQILGSPDSETFQEVDASGVLEWILNYTINNRSIELSAKSPQDPINYIMIWNKLIQ